MARLRNAIVTAIAENPKAVKATKEAHRSAEVALDDAQMEAEVAALRATRARDAVDLFMRTNADALIEELGPEANEVVAAWNEWAARGWSSTLNGRNQLPCHRSVRSYSSTSRIQRSSRSSSESRSTALDTSERQNASQRPSEPCNSPRGGAGDRPGS